MNAARNPPNSSGDLIDRQIVDLDSFNGNTLDKFEIAGLLFYKELDFLVDLAYGVSLDFFDKPQLYQGVLDPVASKLAQLRGRYGCDERFLSQEQRQAILAGVFGQSGGVGVSTSAAANSMRSFAELRDRLLASAEAWAERVYDTSADLLRRAVRQDHIQLKTYLQGRSGGSVHWSRTVGFPAIAETTSYEILRDAGVASRFGIAPPPESEWPFAVDAQGAKIVEEISERLWGPEWQIFSGWFSLKQDSALRGAEALATVIDYNGQADRDVIDLLSDKCYIWFTARGRLLELPIPETVPSRTPVLPAPPAAPLAALTSGPVMMKGNRNRTFYGGPIGSLPSMIS
jgi:hypothetical protein